MNLDVDFLLDSFIAMRKSHIQDYFLLCFVWIVPRVLNSENTRHNEGIFTTNALEQITAKLIETLELKQKKTIQFSHNNTRS